MRESSDSSIATSDRSLTTPATKAGLAVAPQLDLTPPQPLGTWEMGPEPPWFKVGSNVRYDQSPYSLKDSPVLPGLIERPRLLPGVKRWNVDTGWPRSWISVVRWSPDGEWIAAAMTDGHVRIYDAKSLKFVRLLPGASLGGGVADVSWNPDSQQIAIITDNTWSYRVLSLDGQVVSDPPHSHAHAWSAIAWDHKGSRIAVAASGPHPIDNLLIEIRDADGKVLKKIPGLAEGGILTGCLAWSPDDTLLAARHHDGKLRLWNVETGAAEVIDSADPASVFGHSLAWSPEGWLAITTGKEVRLFGPDHRLARKFDSPAVKLGWHPDGKQLICGEFYRSSIRDRDTGAEVGALESSIVAVSPDGNGFIASEGSYDNYRFGMLQLLDGNRKTVVVKSPQFMPYITTLAWSPEGSQLAIANWNRTQLLSANGKQERMLGGTSDASGFSHAWRPDGLELFGGPANLEGSPAPSLWAAAHPQTAKPRRFYSSDKLHRWSATAWSSDSRFAAIGLNEGQVQIIDQAGKQIALMDTGGKFPVYVAVNPVTHAIAVTEPDQPLKFCDPSKGWTLQTVGAKPLVAVQSAPVWSPDGKLLSVNMNGWYDAEGKQVADQSRPLTFAWRPDGNSFCTLQVNYGAQGISICDRDGPERVGHLINGYNSCFDWHPRGNLIVAGTGQSTVTAWREADLQPHWHAVLLPDGKAATFSAAGELLDGKPEEVDQYLVYYVEREAGKIETLTRPSSANCYRPRLPTPLKPR